MTSRTRDQCSTHSATAPGVMRCIWCGLFIVCDVYVWHVYYVLCVVFVVCRYMCVAYMYPWVRGVNMHVYYVVYVVYVYVCYVCVVCGVRGVELGGP